MNEIEVPIGECRCPNSPHPDGDVVWMRDKPDLAMALAARSAMHQSSPLMGEASAAVWSVYIRHGVVRWNLLDEKGKAIPVTFDTILDRMADWLHGGEIVSNRGSELYHESIFLPPAKPGSSSQPPTPSNGSTPRSPESGPPNRNSRKPSSPSPRVAIQ